MLKKLRSLLFDVEIVEEEPEEKDLNIPVFKKEETISELDKPKTEVVDNGLIFIDVEPKEINPVVGKESNPSDVYEFKPVISPMFGVDERSVQNLRPTLAPNIESTTRRNSLLKTVISPIYGDIEERHEVVMEPMEKAEPKVEVIAENMSLNELIHDQDEINPIDIENNQKSEEEAVEQFNLFDEKE
jgi:hypothetical protein